jgi:hypothetical protein
MVRTGFRTLLVWSVAGPGGLRVYKLFVYLVTPTAAHKKSNHCDLSNKKLGL